jgi:hypothetical protein
MLLLGPRCRWWTQTRGFPQNPAGTDNTVFILQQFFVSSDVQFQTSRSCASTLLLYCRGFCFFSFKFLPPYLPTCSAGWKMFRTHLPGRLHNVRLFFQYSLLSCSCPVISPLLFTLRRYLFKLWIAIKVSVYTDQLSPRRHHVKKAPSSPAERQIVSPTLYFHMLPFSLYS